MQLLQYRRSKKPAKRPVQGRYGAPDSAKYRERGRER